MLVVGDRAGERRDEVLLGAGLRRRASATARTTPKVSSSFARTRSSGECAPAAIIGPTNSSASRIARASSGVSRGGAAERVAEELLVDVHLVAVQLGVDGVAAAAEVDEVEQRQVLLERLGRDREALDQLARRDHGLALLAARGEQVGEQRLEDAEALRRDRARPGARRRLAPVLAALGGRLGRRALVRACARRGRPRR